MKGYRIITYGCQANRSDSERVASLLESIGYELADNNPDLVVVNVCSIRQAAVDRAWSKVEKISSSGTKTILTGCILAHDRKIAAEKADLVLDIKDLAKWPEALGTIGKLNVKDYFGIHPKYENRFSAHIPIITGCDNFCTYCVVPYTRGREKSRPFEEIIKETERAINDGCKEIWLLGQNVNSYKDETSDFSQLLKKIESISGEFWFSFLSPHPKDLNKNVLDIMCSSKKMLKYLNLPVQSGDDLILKRMNRPYTVSEYRRSVKMVIETIPEITLSTDVIIGFPGETERAFNNTARLFEDLKFDMAYISKYSPRPGTPSFKMKDDIPHSEKSRRLKILTEILAKTALEKNKKIEGKDELVLVQSKADGLLIGRTRGYKAVRFNGPDDLIGSFINVKIDKVIPWGLNAVIK